MIKLYQKSSTGKTKFLEFSTDGNKFVTTWGLVDGKTQTTTKICEGKNLGKANETTPEQQAILEMEAKIVKKKDEGYRETEPDDEVLAETVELDLDNLPKNFCPSKPIGQSKLTDKVLDDPDTYGTRKYDGHCLILVRGVGPVKIYTRRMEEITSYVKDLPAIKEAALMIPLGSFILYECTYYNNLTGKESPRHVAQVIRKEDAVEALRRYTELTKDGVFSMIPFDALFIDNKFIGNVEHKQRMKLMRLKEFQPPGLIGDWKTSLEAAKAQKWEGLVLRTPGEASYITYTLDGKAKKLGAWKYKFVKTSDFFVLEASKGLSGKHTDFYSRFKVAQYDDDGNIIDRGYVGGGKLSHEELKTLTEDLDSGKKQFPFCVEIEYQSVQDSGALQFGQIQRLREDKIPQECLSEE